MLGSVKNRLSIELYCMDSIDNPSSPSDGGDGEGLSGHRNDRNRWGVYVVLAVGAALLSAAATTTLFWLAGAFDREIVRITEIVEVLDRPVPDTPAALPDDDPVSGLPEPSPNAIASATEPTHMVATVASRAIPSIVTVESYDEESRRIGSGSGVIFRRDGFIVTNDHVINDADYVKVIMSDGLNYPAEMVGTDPLMDIAVVKVEAQDLTAIEFGTMEGLQIGAPAIAVGNPLGLDGGPSITSGVVSAFDRTLVVDFATGDSLYGLLQTDAPITRGSSGGALLDTGGRLLGITTAIGLSDVGAEGLGFAVPVNLVEGIVDDLISDGEVHHAFLGIQGFSAFSEGDYGVESPLGVEIHLLEDSAIGAAGAEDGDVIVALDGEPVKSMPVLVARLRNYRAGDQITVTLDRGEEIVEIDLMLDEYPG